ncbi:hypothetical protein [Thiolapillus sp.]|uniref:hypothetical protein n=1 Tax=Thiolapillus sp. TaxID=2017437 RepID=UPI003AF49812
MPGYPSAQPSLRSPWLAAAVKRRKVQAAFSGGDITSDGGALLLRDMDRRLARIAHRSPGSGVFGRRDVAKIDR